MIGIYKITSPTKRIYIGQSVNIEKRFIDYKKSLKRQQIRLYNSIKKYGYNNHKFEILCECSEKELNNLERYYQDLYSVLSKNGLNCRLTCSDERSGKLSVETIEKLRNKDFNYLIGNNFRKGILHSQEIKNKISITLKNNAKKKDYVNSMTGKFGDLNPFFGKKHSKESLKKMKEKPNSKIVLNTENGVFHYSIKEVSETYNLLYSPLKCRLNGKSKNNTKFIIL